jgi:hypothetical protein
MLHLSWDEIYQYRKSINGVMNRMTIMMVVTMIVKGRNRCPNRLQRTLSFPFNRFLTKLGSSLIFEKCQQHIILLVILGRLTGLRNMNLNSLKTISHVESRHQQDTKELKPRHKGAFVINSEETHFI